MVIQKRISGTTYGRQGPNTTIGDAQVIVCLNTADTPANSDLEVWKNGVQVDDTDYTSSGNWGTAGVHLGYPHASAGSDAMIALLHEVVIFTDVSQVQAYTNYAMARYLI